jgi:threonyl-tRNA synthetase
MEKENSGIDKAVELASIALQGVPLGGVISSVIDKHLGDKRSKRQAKFIEQMMEEIAELQEKLNKEFLSSEDAEELFEKIMITARDTYQTEKLEALKNIFLNSITDSNPKFDEAIEIVELVTGWHPRHIHLLKILADPQKADGVMGSVVGE